MYPLQRHNLVQEAIVARCGMACLLDAFLRQFWQRKEAHTVQAISDAHKHDTRLGKVATVVTKRISRRKATTMDPNQHGQLLILLLCRSQDVQIKAILANGGSLLSGHRLCPLNALHGEVVSLQRSLPSLGRYGCFPPKISHRRFGKWDALKVCHPILDYTLYLSLGNSCADELCLSLSSCQQGYHCQCYLRFAHLVLSFSPTSNYM